MQNITFKWANTDQWTADFSRFQTDLEFDAVKIAAAQIIQNFQGVEKQLFDSEGASGSHGKWPELSEKYREWKEKHYPGKTVMVRTDILKNSLTSQTNESISTVSKVGNSWRIVFGTDAKSKDGFDYPLHHQTTGKTRRGIDPTNQQIAVWSKIIQRHIVGSAARYEHAFDRVTVNREPTFDRVQ
jgi:hypothetical protein